MDINEEELIELMKKMSSTELNEWILKTKKFAKTANKVYQTVKEEKEEADRKMIYDVACNEEQKARSDLERTREEIKRLEEKLKDYKVREKDEKKKLDLAIKNVEKAQNNLEKTNKTKAKESNFNVDRLEEKEVIARGGNPVAKQKDFEIKAPNKESSTMKR